MRNYIILLVISALFITYGCEKKQEEKLLGEWDMLPLSEEFLTQETTWTFYDNNKLVQTIVKDGTTKVDSADYTFSVNAVGKRELTISNLHILIYDGKYSVSELSKSFLKIRRIEKSDGVTGGAFMWREFQTR